MDLLLALKAAQDVDKFVGAIAKVATSLKAQPDVAAVKLTQALGEVSKTLEVVNRATSDYLSLGVDDGALAKSSKLLLEIESGSLRTEVERGRGHCHKIEHIYSNYLNKWFSRVLDPQESAAVSKAFSSLGDADGTLFYQLERVADALQKEAGDVLDLVVKNDQQGAQEKVKSAMAELRPLRKQLSQTMLTIYSMQTQFVDATGAI